MDLYKILEKIMIEKKMSIPDVARACGLSDSTVRSILTRKSKSAALDVAIKLSKGLDVSLAVLNGDMPVVYQDKSTHHESRQEGTKIELSDNSVRMEHINVAKKLREARIGAGFTQKDIYERLGIPQSTFSSWEVGKSEPSAEVLISLCEWYKIDTLAFFREESDNTLVDELEVDTSNDEKELLPLTIEEELKEYINSRYKSLKAFSQEVDIAYTTIDSIFKRGFNKAGINNMIGICKFLEIDIEDLYSGKITPKPKNSITTKNSDESALLKTFRELNGENRAYVKVRIKELLKDQYSAEASDELAISKDVG